jgi:hypothetical protein
VSGFEDLNQVPEYCSELSLVTCCFSADCQLVENNVFGQTGASAFQKPRRNMGCKPLIPCGRNEAHEPCRNHSFAEHSFLCQRKPPATGVHVDAWSRRPSRIVAGGVIGANMGFEFFVALQCEDVDHFIERLAFRSTGRFEPPSTFGATKTAEMLQFDPYQLPAHGCLCRATEY